MKNNRNRTKNVFINSIAGIGGFVFSYVLSFAYRTIFIKVLGNEYLGIQGLFGGILSMLSLAELGLNSAITFSLYEPIANNEHEKIKCLLGLFRKLYFIVAGVVLALGLGCVPFLSFFIKERPAINDSLELIFILYLFNTVASYVSVYKLALIRADQKAYTITVVTNIGLMIRDVAQIAWLLITHNFIGTLLVMIGTTLLTNIVLSVYANRLYPFLKEKKSEVKLVPEESKAIKKKISAMAKYRFGAFVVDGTDSLIISKMVGIVQTGLFSNYQLIFTGVKKIAGYVFTALTPSVGNLAYTSNKDKVKETFDQIIFLNFAISSICSICLCTLINPFIELIWIGKEYCFDSVTVYVFSLNFFFVMTHQSMLIFRNALGLFIYMQAKPIVEAVINIVASLILVHYFGVVGVIAGTIISYACTGFWVEPYVLFRKYFTSGLKEYYFFLLKIFTITMLSTVIIESVKYFLPIRSIWMFTAIVFASIGIPLVTIIIVFRSKPYYIAVKNRMMDIAHKTLKRNTGK